LLDSGVKETWSNKPNRTREEQKSMNVKLTVVTAFVAAMVCAVDAPSSKSASHR
jgi:hypothetical protein